MIENVSFPSRAGADVKGALALPPGEGRAPAVILLHEWWGLNDHVRSLVERLAAAGFVVLAPDLFHGATAPLDDSGKAQKLMSELKWSTALEEIAGAMRYLASHPRSTGKVGVTGFCMGGAGTLAAACNLPGLSAAVAFYGIPPAQYVDWDKADVPPLQMHVASRDQWVKPELAEAIRDRLAARGKHMELRVYEADHAFVNDTRPDVHHPENARLAWEGMVDFFRKHLS